MPLNQQTIKEEWEESTDPNIEVPPYYFYYEKNPKRLHLTINKKRIHLDEDVVDFLESVSKQSYEKGVEAGRAFGLAQNMVYFKERKAIRDEMETKHNEYISNVVERVNKLDSYVRHKNTLYPEGDERYNMDDMILLEDVLTLLQPNNEKK